MSRYQELFVYFDKKPKGVENKLFFRLFDEHWQAFEMPVIYKVFRRKS